MVGKNQHDNGKPTVNLEDIRNILQLLHDNTTIFFSVRYFCLIKFVQSLIKVLFDSLYRNYNLLTLVNRVLNNMNTIYHLVQRYDTVMILSLPKR